MSRRHRVELDADWTVWAECALRGAGFPADEVLRLAEPEAVAAADALRTCEDRLADARTRAVAGWNAALATLHGKDREPFVRAIKATRRGDRPALEDAAAHELGECVAAVAQARAALANTYDVYRARMSQHLSLVLADERYREALVWQNRSALHRMLERLQFETSPSKRRKDEQAIARYVQRYCTKNETIGFFGPVGWVTIGADAGVVVEPGPALVATRDVYLEHWCIDEIASALAGDPELRLDLAPRLLPTVSVQAQRVYRGTGAGIEVSATIAALLQACDGERTAREIAASLQGVSETDVYELLDELVELELITWTLEVPYSRQIDRWLRSLLERVRETPARARALAAVDRVVAARERIATAVGPDEIDRALGELDATFTDITGAAATRRAGATYAGRTLVYLDCRRDVQVSLGRGLLERFARVLTPILRSARWYTFEIARRYRALAERTHDALGGGDVPLLRWWERMSEHFSDNEAVRSPVVDEVAGGLADKWRELLPAGPDARRVQLRGEDVAAGAERAFAAPAPGWPSARHLSPDVMISAPDVDAIARGECTFVLGELHIGNTLTPFLAQHPDPKRFVGWIEDDIDVVGISPAESRGGATRGNLYSQSERDFHVELGPSRSWRRRDHVLRGADLVVRRNAHSLEVCAPGRGVAFDVIAYLDRYLQFASIAQFKLVTRAGHSPRITVDNVVLAREQWILPAEDFAFTQLEAAEDRFVGARRWADRHGFPRLVFAKVPQERKPIFVDFEAPITVELLVRMLRVGSSVSISEMLPDLDHLWLPDAAGRRYTSELRLVVVDAQTWRPA